LREKNRAVMVDMVFGFATEAFSAILRTEPLNVSVGLAGPAQHGVTLFGRVRHRGHKFRSGRRRSGLRRRQITDVDRERLEAVCTHGQRRSSLGRLARALRLNEATVTVVRRTRWEIRWLSRQMGFTRRRMDFAFGFRRHRCW